jgi:hypothetical protein
MQLKQSTIEKLLLDPVLAAWAIMGIELDIFQQARLRFYWWTPVTVDSSGVSTAKTLEHFIYVNLRCILISDHVSGSYFPNFQTAKDEFWPYYGRFIETAPVFRDQFKMDHNKLGEHKYPGAWVMDYKNKSRHIMPAPSFMTDAQTQASRRFNTLVVDDWLRAEDMGEGISKQLVDRVTRACFNKNHPIWCNHQKFLGHAETPQHKGYMRYRGYRRAILDGSQRHSTITFSFRDWTPRFAAKYREDNVIADARRTLTTSQFERQYDGVWSRDGANYYPEAVLYQRCRQHLFPYFGRLYDNEINTLGFDVAQSTSIRADWTSAVVHRIVEICEALEIEIERKNRRIMDERGPSTPLRSARDDMLLVPPVTCVADGRKYNRAFSFAHRLKNADVVAISGLIHLFHRIFGFAKIVLDPRGGGLAIYEQLKKTEQTIDGIATQVIPLCTRFEPIQADKQPIVCFFQRGGELDEVVMPQFLVAEEGFIEWWHKQFRQSWEAGEHEWPMPIADRSPAEVKRWRREQLWAQRLLDAALAEISSVRTVTAPDGITPLMSKRGFRMFDAKAKKDLAYSSLMGFAGGEVILKQGIGVEEGETAAMFV